MLLEKLKDYRIILASGSPRRQILLTSLGINFELCTDYPVEEEYPSVMAGEEIPLFLARKKSIAYPHKLQEKEILITADTVVCIGEKVLDKPENAVNAAKTLRTLSGKSHYVYSAVYIRDMQTSTDLVSETKVYFGKLSDEEIDYYIQNYKPYDKAGAYGIQEWLGYIAVEKIEGSFFNVMGLPIHKLYKELEKFINTST